MTRARPSEIAIVGMGCRFPGAADLCTYFENILARKDCTGDIPPDRWDPRIFHDPASTANDRVPCRRGGYLDEPILFAAAEQGIMPRTVEGGEPEQFLVLEAALAALADAGIAVVDLKKKRVDVIIGRGNYFNRGNLTRLQHGRMVAQTMALLAALHPDWSDVEKEKIRGELKSSLPPFEASTIPGQLTNATAGRIASRLDTSGASLVVDAASASSLVALDLAVRALVTRRADLAIAGGVYLEADIDFPLVFRQLNASSSSGSARPFAADADGMLSGEGAGIVVLKRRVDAERDGNRIYAIIRGIGIASDGRGQGLAAPSARGHAHAIRRAYRHSGIDPATVGLIEGHGLGVPAADRAELRALNAIFPVPAYGRRALGAVSSMIGHAMPAAGIAGLIKTALALHHRVLPPTLHADHPHPLIEQPGSAFQLNAAARPWITPDSGPPRRAGVNAFGFAGINAHAVLEEHAQSADGDKAGALTHWDSEAILLAAPDRRQLIDRAQELIDWIGRGDRNCLKDVAFTLNRGFKAQGDGVRLGLVVPSLTELSARLSALLPRLADPKCHTIRDGRGVYFWDKPLLKAGKGGLAFLFPGEGSQYPGMLADLCIHFPDVRRMFDIADRIALELGEPVPPSEHLYNHAHSGGDELWSTATAVNVVLTSQRALNHLLTRLGLVPNAIVGHSSGEILALAAAGVLRADGVLERQLGRLGEIFRGFETAGDVPEARLVAVATARDRVEAICRDLRAPAVVVAIDNCPHQVVLAGPPPEVDRVVRRLREDNIPVENLPFDRAYHTAGFSSVIGPIADFFAQSTFKVPAVPVYSCATHSRMPDDPDAIRELAIAQWTRTVAFRETIETMHADGLRVFVDVGARGNLAGFVEDILRGKPAFAIAANLPRRGGLTQLNHLVAATFAQGASLNPDYLYARRRPCLIDWNAAVHPQRTTIELKIGFPEMRLSDEFIEKFNSNTTSADANAREDLCEQCSTAGERPPASHSLEAAAGLEAGDFFQNPDAADLRAPRFENRFAAEHASSSYGWETRPRFGKVGPEADTAHLEYESHAVEPSLAEDAMLLFQRTMQSFLETQQAVMGAYLGLDETMTETPDEQSGPSLDFVPISNGHHEPRHESVLHGETYRNGNGRSASHPERDESTAAGGSKLPSPPYVTILSSSTPGPWAGQPMRVVQGTEIETVLILDGRDDPLAHHHTLGGRRASALDPTLKGLPVLPFAAMAEMTAQVAALVVTPGLVLTRLEQVKAHKWVRYEDEPVHLRMRGERVSSSGDERVLVGIYNHGPGGRDDAPRPVFEAVAIYSTTLSDPPAAQPWSLEDPRVSRFTAESIYRDSWLFHGPPLQALVHIGHFSDQGMDGTLRVLPWEPLLKAGQAPRLHVDPIVLDAFTHLLGCWGLDYFHEGDVIFPLRMEELEIHGERPANGTDVACQISVLDIDRHRIRVQAEVIRPDGTVWMQIRNWEDWRFHWPGRYRDVFRLPQDFFVGEELELEGRAVTAIPEARMVWLEPPADMGRPIWRDVLEQTQLGPDERATFLASAGPDRRRSQRLWGRVAAKEAARRIWRSAGLPVTYPADLAVLTDDLGRPILVPVDRPGDRSLPAISISHSDGVAVALAAADPHARIGIDVEPIVERPAGFEETAFTAAEQLLLNQFTDSTRTEWLTRFWCAKEAAAKASGMGMSAGPSSAEVIDADTVSGVIHVRLAPELLRNEASIVNAVGVGSGKLRNEASVFGLEDLRPGGVLRNEASAPELAGAGSEVFLRNEARVPESAGAGSEVFLRNEARVPESAGAGSEVFLRNEARVPESAGAGSEVFLRNEASLSGLVRVVSARRGDHAWAWTLGEGAEL